MNMHQIDIIVLANKHRKPLVEEYLDKIPHKTSLTPDYNLPNDFKPTPRSDPLFISNHTGALRCYNGHIDALKLTTEDIVLVLEDDAIPNCPNWLEIVHKSIDMLNKFEIVSLHGRSISGIKNRIIKNGLEFLELEPIEVKHEQTGKKGHLKYILGSLAYLIHKRDINKIIDSKYDGFPFDFKISNDMKFCVIKNSPFDHNRSQPSLVEHPAEHITEHLTDHPAEPLTEQPV